MKRDRRGDRDGVDVAVGEKIVVLRVCLRDPVPLGGALRALHDRIADGSHPHSILDVGLREVGEDAADADRSRPDDTDAHGAGHRQRKVASGVERPGGPGLSTQRLVF